MDDDFDELVVSVRAETSGFAQDVAAMKREFDTGLVSGFDAAGRTLEKSLASALRNGKLEFEDLKRVALSVLDQIFGSAGGSGSGGGGAFAQLAGFFTTAIGSFLGLPGRATGGLVGPDRPYLVGERGPEVFVPTSAGHIEPSRTLGQAGKNVRVSISLNQPRGASAPVAMQRSSRQVASAVRRALSV